MKGNEKGLAVLAAAAALALAACGGSASTPQVANLGTASSNAGNSAAGAGPASSATARPSNATALVDEWAACERSHGDPTQADPVIDAYGVINITIPQSGVVSAAGIRGLTGACSQYLAQAQRELEAANPVPPAPDEAENLKFVECMRANGVPGYPYPQGDKTYFQGTGVNPDSPQVVNVSKLCGKKLDLPAWWVDGTGPPGDISVATAGLPHGGTPPSCFFAKVNPCSGNITRPAGSGRPSTSFGASGNG